jgi:hypothetical protein
MALEAWRHWYCVGWVVWRRMRNRDDADDQNIVNDLLQRDDGAGAVLASFFLADEKNA